LLVHGAVLSDAIDEAIRSVHSQLDVRIEHDLDRACRASLDAVTLRAFFLIAESLVLDAAFDFEDAEIENAHRPPSDDVGAEFVAELGAELEPQIIGGVDVRGRAP